MLCLMRIYNLDISLCLYYILSLLGNPRLKLKEHGVANF